MLDTIAAPGNTPLVDKIYGLAGGEGDLTALLDLVAARFGADSLMLLRVGRGDETELGRVGPPCADRMLIEAAASLGGRRLAFALSAKTAPDAATQEGLRDLLPHLERALSLSAKLEAFEAERALGSELLDRMAVGTVFLDKTRRIVTMTGMADSMVSAGDGVRARNGCLIATDGSDDRALQAAIRSVLSDPLHAPTGVLRLTLAHSKRTVGVVVKPVEQTRSAGRIACAVVIRDGARMCEPQIDMLKTYFDLTAAEAMLTRNLAAGLTLDEAAESLNIRRNTARAHLRAIFSKCGVKRQTELMRLVLASVAMLGGAEAAA